MYWLKTRSFVLPAALSGLLASTALAQGTITGRVTAQTTGEPLQEARVMVVGTQLFTLAGPDGRYTLRRVPAGTADIRVLRVGYTEQKKSVRVLDDQTATLDFAMSQSVVQLDEIVATATGEQRRVEIGNAVSNIPTTDVVQAEPIRNLPDLVNGRVPGVMVETGNQTGTGARVRIRGVSSISLSNDPIYVIDGIRMTSTTGAINYGDGGALPSRVSDLDPESIENIEVVKGPSAATLYGTDAANGVIVITTKRGRTGNAKWSAFGEAGRLDDRNWYSTNYTLAGNAPGVAGTSTPGAPLILGGQCTLPMVSLGTCVNGQNQARNVSGGVTGFDSLRTYDPIHDPDATPLGLGSRNAYGVNVSGGSDAVRYFMSAGRDNEIGTFHLPAFEVRRYDSLGVTPHDWTMSPNASLRNSFRTNLNATLTPQLDVGVSFGYVTIDQRYTNESNATAGIGSQAFGGPGYKNNGTIGCSVSAPGNTTCLGTNTPLNGYRAWTPAYTWEERIGQTINRSLLSTNLNWTPLSWFQGRVNAGTDLTDQVDTDLRYNSEGPPLNSTYRDGFAGNSRRNINNLSLDASGSASYTPGMYPWLNLKTTLGTQYNNFRNDRNVANGTTLPPGASTAGAASTQAANELFTLQKTWGIFVEEDAAVRDHLFLTGALRTDQNSAFGTNFQRVYYPKASASWVISDEDFFPHGKRLNEILSNLRLRVAYGASGVQPGQTDALQLYAVQTASLAATDKPVETFNNIGNDSLRPERSTEWEFGYDSRWWNRIEFDLTYYSKLTHDALINAIIPPSAGTGASTQRANIGAVKNSGFELTLGGTALDTRRLGLDFNLSTSLTANKVVSLGNTPRQVGTTNWIVAGYPINGLWARPIVYYKDKNHDGILTYNSDTSLTEVYVLPDTIFRGYAEPRYLTTLTSGIDLFNHKVRIQNLFDWRAGNKWYNNTERIRCVSRQNCDGLMNPNASLQEQAMVVATLNDPSHTLDGFFQPGAFVKWREASVSFELPQRLLTKTNARTANFVFTVRNVKMWTHYRGTDPESDFTITDGTDAPAEFQTFGQPTYFLFRLNLGF